MSLSNARMATRRKTEQSLGRSVLDRRLYSGEEGLMKRFLKPLLTAAILTIGAGTAPSCAFEQEVNNVWWALYDNYNGGPQSACIAKSYNDHAIDAVFDLFPASYDADGSPMPSRMVITMSPYQTYKLFGWENVPGPGPRCELHSFTVHVP